MKLVAWLSVIGARYETEIVHSAAEGDADIVSGGWPRGFKLNSAEQAM